MSFAVPVDFGSHLFFVGTHGRVDPDGTFRLCVQFSQLLSSMMVALLMCHENVINGLWIVDLIIWIC